jgi:hypothetical protein
MVHRESLINAAVARSLFGVVLLLFAAPYLQGESFPKVRVSNLAGQELSLPGALAGRSSFFVIGFSQSSEKQTTVWRKEIEQAYSSDPQLVVYPVIGIENIPRIFHGLLIAGIRAGVPRDTWNRFLVVSAEESKWKGTIGWQGPDIAYLLLLDRGGAIAWRGSGAYTEAAAASLAAAVQRLEK